MADTAMLGEAPVSWNTRYMSKQGFECQLTLRGTDPGDLLRLANDLMTRMVEAGVEPLNGYRKGNGKPEAQDDHVCPIHKVPMKRYEKNGQAWYSHKAPDGSWCRGT